MVPPLEPSARPLRVAPLTPPPGRASTGSAPAQAAHFRPAGDSRGARSSRLHCRTGRAGGDEAADILLPSRAGPCRAEPRRGAGSRSDLRVRKQGVRRGRRRRGRGRRGIRGEGVAGSKVTRGRGGAGSAEEGLPGPPARQSGRGFIHSRPLGRGPAPQPPGPRSPPEAPSGTDS